MKYLFIIQGEGRGHMTQALSMSQILRQEGHEVVRVIVGKSNRRNIPEFFKNQIGTAIDHLDSPNFVTDRNQKSVKPLKTVFYSLWHIRKYLRSITEIDRIIQESKPDVVVNFYDFLAGIYFFLKRPKITFISLAHQFLIAHPQFDFPNGRYLDRLSMKIGNAIAGFGSKRILALSFQSFSDVPQKRIYVVPPLLRKEIKTLKISTENHLLVYMVNPGYGEDVDRFHKEYPDQPIHCFWDMKDKPDEWKVDETLTFHQLSDQKFMTKMASAKGYVTTAGFESVCEAMYLGKPVLMVPVAGHYEQACNAVDAVKAGAGIASDTFDIEKLVEYLPAHKPTTEWFQKWADSARDHYLKQLTHL